MEYKDIVSVTGLPGLFQLVSSKGNGIVVRSLNGENTRFVSARSHNFTPLESIEVFTSYENVPLADVFHAMKKHESDTQSVDVKSKNEVNDYFETVFPSLDKDRVYLSDMKKMLKWYPLLKEYDLLPEEEAEENEEIAEEGNKDTDAGAESEEKNAD